jgi:hypothetical protein
MNVVRGGHVKNNAPEIKGPPQINPATARLRLTATTINSAIIRFIE